MLDNSSVSFEWLTAVTSTSARLSLACLSCLLAWTCSSFCFIFHHCRLRVALFPFWIANSLCFSKWSESFEFLEDGPEYLELFEDLDLHNWSNAELVISVCLSSSSWFISLSHRIMTLFALSLFSLKSCWVFIISAPDACK